MQAHDRAVDRWFELIRSGQIRLPRFQRFEAWSYQNVTGLLDTITRDLPAGAVLVLETKGSEPFVSRPVVGAPDGPGPVSEHLLDGQQRLTALWRALHDDYADRSYYVSLDKDEETGRDTYAVSRGRWEKEGQRYPLYLNAPAELWRRKLLPVYLFRPGADAEAESATWVQEAATTGDAGPDYKVAMEITLHLTRLRQQFARFNIPYLALPETTPAETALDVFIQMNTSATPLSTYDIVVAQVEAGAGRSLHDLSTELRESAPDMEAYASTQDLMLAAAALLQGKTTNRTSALTKGFPDQLIEDWPVLQRGMRRAVAFLKDERIFDAKRLPTDVVLPPLVALWGEAPEGLDAEGEARGLLRTFLWRACFTDRYERASNSRILTDYRALRTRLQGGDASPEVLDDEAYPLPNADLFLEAGWPTRKDRLARALLALSLRRGGFDFADGAPANRETLARREYHHLFPVAYLRDLGVDEGQSYRALNCALVTWRTNRTIAAKAPGTYLAERLEASSLGEPEIRRRLEAHLIPFEPLMAGEYGDFLLARAETMHAPMRELCSGRSIG